MSKKFQSGDILKCTYKYQLIKVLSGGQDNYYRIEKLQGFMIGGEIYKSVVDVEHNFRKLTKLEKALQ